MTAIKGILYNYWPRARSFGPDLAQRPSQPSLLSRRDENAVELVFKFEQTPFTFAFNMLGVVS